MSDPQPPGMGVSSERVGHTGPGQVGTHGVKDTTPAPRQDKDEHPEEAPGGPERNPEGLPPKADPPSLDPRSD